MNLLLSDDGTGAISGANMENIEIKNDMKVKNINDALPIKS